VDEQKIQSSGVGHYSCHADLNPRLARIQNCLACPRCRVALERCDDGFRCSKCQKIYPIRNQKVFFIEAMRSTDPLDRIKETIKRGSGNFLYRVVLPLVNPTFPFSYRKAIARYVDSHVRLVVDLGSGNHRLDNNVIAVDGVDYPAVDIVADLTALPFLPNSIDMFASRSVLEHIHPLGDAIAGIKQATAPGGINLHLVPFLYPFHSSIGDYQRLTHMAMARFFENWKILEQRQVTGPFTLFLTIFVEFFAILLSFGNARLKAFIYLLLCVIFFPIKFFDLPFLWSKRFLTIAPTILTVVQKPADA
jgi:SAM-dependent methyltransferase